MGSLFRPVPSNTLTWFEKQAFNAFFFDRTYRTSGSISGTLKLFFTNNINKSETSLLFLLDFY